MGMTSLVGVDGYTYADLDDAARLIGPIRSARKVLPRTTIDLARHATYAAAVHQLDAVGGAAALNHDRAGDGQPFAMFAAEVAEWSSTSGFAGHTTLGLSAEEAGDALTIDSATQDAATIESAVASIDLSGKAIVVASEQDEGALSAAATGAGAASVAFEPHLPAALQSGADVAFVRGKTGAIDHVVAAEANVGHIVGLQPLTTTARGLAVASRAGAIVVPDFVSAAGPYLAALDRTADIAQLTRSAVERIGDAGVDSFVRACELAEDHLRSWATELPFGRPLAP